MNINPTTAATATTAAKLNTVQAKQAYGIQDAQPKANADRVELSKADGFQRLVEMAKGGDIRADKVADMKAQIAAGTYDLDAKADTVAERMLEDF